MICHISCCFYFFSFLPGYLLVLLFFQCKIWLSVWFCLLTDLWIQPYCHDDELEHYHIAHRLDSKEKLINIKILFQLKFTWRQKTNGHCENKNSKDEDNPKTKNTEYITNHNKPTHFIFLHIWESINLAYQDFFQKQCHFNLFILYKI